jgi:HK97 family phage major capsid protein
MDKSLQEQLKETLGQADAIKSSAAAKGKWEDGDTAAFNSLIDTAKNIKGLMEKEVELDALKAWGQESDGKSAVAAGFSGRVIEDEGNMKGVTTGSDYNDLVPYTALGEKTLKSIKSGEYKDAYRQMLVAAAKRQAPSVAAMKVLQEGQDTAGGFWVPPDIRNDLVKKMRGVTGVMNDVFAFTTGSDMVTFPKITYTGGDIYTSDVLPSWTAEAPSADISEATNPGAGKVQIPVHTLTAAIIVTRSLLEDAQFDILGYLSENLGENIGLYVDNALINGDGVGKPQGILKHPNAAVAVASGGMLVLSGAAAAVAFGNSTTGIIGTEAALPPQYEAGAKWYAGKSTYAAIRSLNVGTANQPIWRPDESYPNATNGYAPTLYGYPIAKDQFMPTVGASNTPLMLGQLKGYFMPQRVGMSIQVLNEVRALRDEVVLYARMRLGGQLVKDWQVKLMKSNNA